jgi:putative ABC transport system substrate-binding protein
MADMRRRDFIALLGGAAAAWPLAARGQQPSKLPTIGFLGQATASVQSQWTAAFLRRLRELGWEEGRTVAIEYRWAEGHSERFAEIATEFAERKVDVIVTAGTAPVLAAKQATSVIPIVFAAAGNPVATGLVTSLARPGGNVTGLSNQATDIASKRIELMREVLPGLRKLAVLVNIDSPIGVLEISEVQAAGRALGVDVVPLEIRRREDIAAAIEGVGTRTQALYTVSEPLAASNRLRINMLALGARLPTMHDYREYVEMGGLMSYGANFPDLYRRTANLVDKILRGAKPGTLPVEQPTKFELVVNLITAKALGLDIPATLLARADEVIE